MSTIRVVLTGDQASRGRLRVRAEVLDRRGDADVERGAWEGADVTVEADRLELRREREPVAGPRDLGSRHDRTDRRDDVLHRWHRPRGGVDGGALRVHLGG